MKHYRAYGLTLASETAFPELILSTDPNRDICVRFTDELRARPEPAAWFLSCCLPTGEPWLLGAKDGDGYVVRFPDFADFYLDRQGRDLTCHPLPAVPSDTLRHLLLDQVLPLVLNLRGQNALHATAVLTPSGVGAFTGPTGSGKSTLAARFLQAGFPVVSDDCLVLQGQEGQHRQQKRLYAVPAYPGVRLWRDTLEVLYGNSNQFPLVAHYADKRRVVFSETDAGFPVQAQPLLCIYFLVRLEKEAGQAAAPRIEPLSQREAYTQLLPQLFRLDITDREMLKHQFDWLGQVVEQVPVRRLVVPNDLAALDQVRAAVLADLDSCT